MVFDILGCLNGISIVRIALLFANVPSRLFSFKSRSLAMTLNRNVAILMPWGTPAVAIWEIGKVPLIYVINVLYFK